MSKRNWYKVRELIAKLEACPPDSDVLLAGGVYDAEAAKSDTFGWPAGLQTLGANCVIFDDKHVWILHSTKPDEI